MPIDLHTHSTASDGTDAPAELVRRAKAAGLTALALTDHDTLSGLPEAQAAGRELGVEVVPGVELSASTDFGNVHILGLWLPPDPAGLTSLFGWLRRARDERNREMAARLNALGIGVTLEEAATGAGDALGRPHFARALLLRGVVNSYDQAFHEYLGPRGKAYVPKAKLPAARALEVLRGEGATPVLAHPVILGLKPAELEELLVRLRGEGLEGLEVFYSEHSARQTEQYARLAGKLGLLATGGSDYHGQVKPNIRLRVGKGNLYVPDEVLARLKAHRADLGLWT